MNGTNKFIYAFVNTFTCRKKEDEKKKKQKKQTNGAYLNSSCS